MKREIKTAAALFFCLVICGSFFNVRDSFAAEQNDIFANEVCTDTNADAGYANNQIVEPPVFSQRSCFSDENISLTLTSTQENIEIYYTLDGSDPTVDSAKYVGAIEITNASGNENNYSARTDVSPHLSGDTYNGGFCIPKSKVDKGTVVKAICVNSEGEASDISSEIYFVGLSENYEYKDIPVVALWASEDDLFGYEKGIYVLGKKFDEYKKTGLDYRVWKWEANYSEDREITGEMAYFNDINSTATREQIDLELKGAASRRFPQKSFNISGTTKRFCLANGGNDIYYKMKDSISSALAEDLDVVYSQYEPCQVFLNGEYWGLYYIGDRLFSKKYYKAKYGISGKGFAIIKNKELNEGNESDLKEYNELVSYIRENDMTNADKYNAVKEKINIESMIDYYCIETFICNTDWPNNNYACWRADKTDKKWKYILFDTNIEGAFENASTDMMSQVFNQDPVFKSLYKNSEFRRKFMCRYLELTENQFAYEKTKGQLDSLYTTGAKYIQSYFDRYLGGTRNISSYTSQYQLINRFLSNRAAYALEDITQLNKNNAYSEQFLDVEAFTLSGITFECDGEEHKPEVTAKDLKEGTDYIVSYDEDCTSVGEKNVIITGLGKYVGTKTLKYNIVEPCKHQLGELVVAKKPTCTEAGMEAYYCCDVCKKYFDKDENPVTKELLMLKATGHSYYRVSAGKGCYYYRCSGCGRTKGHKAPSYVKSFKVSKGKKCFTAKWKMQTKTKQKRFSGYQLRYSAKKSMEGAKYKKVSKKKSGVTIKKLKGRTRYYVQVRSYTGRYYSDWSSVKSVKTK